MNNDKFTSMQDNKYEYFECEHSISNLNVLKDTYDRKSKAPTMTNIFKIDRILGSYAKNWEKRHLKSNSHSKQGMFKSSLILWFFKYFR